MSDGRVELEARGSIAWLILNNPAKRNAISLGMWRQLNSILHELDDGVRCIVVRGIGDKAFASGADISELAGHEASSSDFAALDEAADRAMARLYNMPQPTVAMISGYCFGAGLALALCCDVRLASETGMFAIPAARLGVGYSAENIMKLMGAVSIPVATDILVSARRYSAAEALAAGLVNRVFAAHELAGEVEAYVAAIARNAPLTVRASKRIIKELARNSEADLALCKRLVDACITSEDYIEGRRAFMEKRDPLFYGK